MEGLPIFGHSTDEHLHVVGDGELLAGIKVCLFIVCQPQVTSFAMQGSLIAHCNDVAVLENVF